MDEGELTMLLAVHTWAATFLVVLALPMLSLLGGCA